MKRKKVVIYIAIIILILVSIDIYQNNFNRDSVSEISVIDLDIRFQIPITWVIDGGTMYYEDKPVFWRDVCFFDEELLKEAFFYETTEQCLRRYCPLGVGLGEVVKKEVGKFTIYEIHGSELDIYSEEEGGFISSEDEMYIDFIIQSEKKEIYCFYFMNSMADSKKIDEFFSKASWYERTADNDGRYRWMLQ